MEPMFVDAHGIIINVMSPVRKIGDSGALVEDAAMRYGSHK